VVAADVAAVDVAAQPEAEVAPVADAVVLAAEAVAVMAHPVAVVTEKADVTAVAAVKGAATAEASSSRTSSQSIVLRKS
jgi:hypothetical protein